MRILLLCVLLTFTLGCDIGQLSDLVQVPDTGQGSGDGGSVVDDRILINHTTTDIREIPDSAINQAKADLHIAYNHTSHGSQLRTGMYALEAFPAFGQKYEFSSSESVESLHILGSSALGGTADLSQGDSVNGDGDTPWVVDTRAFLDNPNNSHINVVVWSWCSINNHDAQRYVDNMEKLVTEYPEVQFVFMTGHAEGRGIETEVNTVHYNNELIRKHCEDNKRILYDFADIESYNPEGEYFWDRNMRDNLDYGSGNNWAVEWIAANPNHLYSQLTTGIGIDGYDGCNGTAHSSSPQEANLNGVLKGMSAWWLWARLAGWDGLNP